MLQGALAVQLRHRQDELVVNRILDLVLFQQFGIIPFKYSSLCIDYLLEADGLFRKAANSTWLALTLGKRQRSLDARAI